MEDRERIWREDHLRGRALNGDKLAWQELFDSSYDRLWKAVISRSSLLAEDIIQETWLIAVRRLDSFDPRKGSFESWINGIAWRVLSHRMRVEGRNRGVRLDFDPAMAECETIGDSDRVKETLALLSPAYAEALKVRYLQGRGTGELARLMKRSYKSAESLLSRARAAFKHAFERGSS